MENDDCFDDIVDLEFFIVIYDGGGEEKVLGDIVGAEFVEEDDSFTYVGFMFN